MVFMDIIVFKYFENFVVLVEFVGFVGLLDYVEFMDVKLHDDEFNGGYEFTDLGFQLSDDSMFNLASYLYKHDSNKGI